ncbi:MAG: restriction endonuclease subunit S [Pseudomonadota bacterium]
MALTIPVAEIVESSRNPLLGKHASWGRVLLGEIATIQNGFPFKSTQFTKSAGMPLIRIRDVGANCTDTNYVGDYDPAFIVKADDLLIGMDGDFNCARWRGPDGLLNQRVCRVILKSDIYHPKLLDYALPGYLKAINDMTSSVTVKHLSSKSIAEIPLPLPPMGQQKRIVAEIEKQFSRLDEAVASLKRVKANLKRYKAAVLKAAVEGRLVETEAELARREGRGYETGEQLLQRILETRRSQWKGKGKYKEPAAPDTTDLPELPEGWVWTSVDQLTGDSLIGLDRGRDQQNSEGIGTPYVKMNNVTMEGEVTSEGLVYVDASNEEKERFNLQATDLLFNTRNSKELVGKVGIVASLPRGAIYNNNLMRLRTINGAMPSFVCSQMCSNGFRKRMELVKKATTNVAAVYAKDLFPLPLALPPLTEQQRIVAEVDRRLSLISEVEAQVDANLLRADRLRQSILTSAFSGLLGSRFFETMPNAATKASGKA